MSLLRWFKVTQFSDSKSLRRKVNTRPKQKVEQPKPDYLVRKSSPMKLPMNRSSLWSQLLADKAYFLLYSPACHMWKLDKYTCNMECLQNLSFLWGQVLRSPLQNFVGEIKYRNRRRLELWGHQSGPQCLTKSLLSTNTQFFLFKAGIECRCQFEILS